MSEFQIDPNLPPECEDKVWCTKSGSCESWLKGLVGCATKMKVLTKTPEELEKDKSV